MTLRIAFVVEGETDFEVLSAWVKARHPEAQTELIVPKGDETGGQSGVARYLRHKGRQLLTMLRFGGQKAMILHLDGDVVGVRCPQGSAAQQWEAVDRWALRKARLERWPVSVVRAYPLQRLEAWICAARSCRRHTPQLECEENPIAHLREEADRRAAETRRASVYRDTFAKAVVERWEQVKAYCPVSAGRFEEDWFAALGLGEGRDE